MHNLGTFSLLKTNLDIISDLWHLESLRHKEHYAKENVISGKWFSQALLNTHSVQGSWWALWDPRKNQTLPLIFAWGRKKCYSNSDQRRGERKMESGRDTFCLDGVKESLERLMDGGEHMWAGPWLGGSISESIHIQEVFIMFSHLNTHLAVYRILTQIVSQQNVDVFTLIVFQYPMSPIKYNLMYLCFLSFLKISFFFLSLKFWNFTEECLMPL